MPSSIHPTVEVHLDHSPFLMPLLMTQLVYIYSDVYQSNKSLSRFFLLVAPEDYLSTSGGMLTFNIGDARQCHDVGIVDDVIYEIEVEQFFSNLALVSGAPVTVDPPSIRVIIFDDTDDC